MKILIATNHSYMFYRFRKELVEALMQEHEVILSTPFVGHEDDLQAMGLRCIETDIDRRSINPFKDMKLLKTYRQMLDELQPDMVVTYSIKPNIYMGTACKAKGIPYVTNVQGLGTAFEKPVLSSVVSVMYRSALRKAKTVFFENEENAQFFLNKKIISHRQVSVLPGAGINLDEYPCVPMGDDGVCSFLFVGRIMKEKGVDEFFSAARTLKAEFGGEVAFDVVGFYEDAYKEQVDQLVADGIVRSHKNGIVTKCSHTGGDHGWQLFSVSRWTAEDGQRLRKHLELEFVQNENRSIYWDDVAMFCHPDEYQFGVYPISAEDLREIDSFTELCEADSSYRGRVN